MGDDPKTTDGRWKCVWVSTVLLSDFLRGKMDAVKSTTAPDDLTVVAVHHVWPGDKIAFVVWSASFESITTEDGLLKHEIPFVDYTYTSR